MLYSLQYSITEHHLVLPRYSPYIISQTIYDLLFQYVLTPERETMLKNFVHELENYTKSRPSTPFSISLEKLSAFGDGVDELRMLNWLEVPVKKFKLSIDESTSPEEKENIIAEIQNLMLANYNPEENCFYVFPRQFVW